MIFLDIRNTRHSLSSNVDDFPLDLFQFKCKDLTIGATLVEGTRQMHVKVLLIKIHVHVYFFCMYMCTVL